jgi:hypothetical protein
MTNGEGKPSFFARYIDDPPPIKKEQEPSPAQKLLDFLQRWNKSTIATRDIRIYGPGSIRDRKTAVDAAEVLVRTGWLVPLKPYRYGRKWQIIERPRIVAPKVASLQQP